jgi:hypothetical protein
MSLGSRDVAFLMLPIPKAQILNSTCNLYPSPVVELLFSYFLHSTLRMIVFVALFHFYFMQMKSFALRADKGKVSLWSFVLFL